MSELICTPDNGCKLSCVLWGKHLDVRIHADLVTAQRCMDSIKEKLSRIERNREKLSQILYTEMAEYCDGETPEQFAAALYLTRVYVDIYRDDTVCVCFTVKSRRRYTIDAERDFELHHDNSLE